MSRRSSISSHSLTRVVLLAACLVGSQDSAHSQSSLSESSLRPFVVGVVPVVGNSGAVGGVAIDAHGVIDEADQRDVLALRDARRAALEGIAGDVARPSKLRKISLRRLAALLAAHVSRNEPLTPDVLYLAGLQRVSYVFAYPELHDLVLAGPAEPWTIDDAGNAVGVDSGAAVLQLDDLIAALRSSDNLLAGEMISCSIDPTLEGLQRLSRLLHNGPTSPSTSALRQMEEALGPQTISLTGVPSDSHFAQVLVAADWKMKRIGMGLVRSPVEGLPSYLELLKEKPKATPQDAMPRWWIAYGSRPVERDDEGLGWRLSPPGIQVLTAATRLSAAGARAPQVESDPMAKVWADAMTAHYDDLAIAEPIFGQLRSCMDLALVAAVLAVGDLTTQVGLELPMLLDDARLQLAQHGVPKTAPSHASAIRRSHAWLVSVSGGVELDMTHAVNAAGVKPQVRDARTHASPRDAASWWWD